MSKRRSPKILLSTILLLSAISVIGASYQNQIFVFGAPTITLNPTSGIPGTFVAISGSGFAGGDFACTLSPAPAASGSVVSNAPGPGACTILGGTMSDSFTVGLVAAGSYVVQIQGNTGDSATATFTVTGPKITLTPSSGFPGTTVSVSGGGFIGTDTGCSISGSIVAALPISVCSVSLGVVSGSSFTVSNTATPGPYSISVLASLGGDSASATFTVTVPTPTITLTPHSGSAGTTVSVTGSGFNAANTGCSISGGIVAAAPVPVCTISLGVVSGSSFTVSNTATPGTYSISVLASPGGDSASTTFTVVGPAILLIPSSGPAGTTVSVSGSGFNPNDDGCAISGSIVGGGSVCNIANGHLTAATFIVSNGAIPGPYTITVSTSIAATPSDSAQATFTVATTSPTITLNPSIGTAGTAVSISGSGFNPNDNGCSISGSGGVVATAPAAACSIAGGHLISATFTVDGTRPPGTYVITVSASIGATLTDSAQAIFTVVGPTISLNPTSGVTGTTVSVTGSGFVFTDAGGCLIFSSTPTNIVGGVPSCTISASGTVTGSFDVLFGSIPGIYVVTVGGSTGDFAQATFLVLGPAIVLNPNSGPVGTTVSITGSGFPAADAGLCVISSSPTPIITPVGCTITPGGTLTSTSFNINLGAALGPYVIKVAGGTGDFATAIFTVTTPTPSITLNPNPASSGAPVSVSGSGFNVADAGVCAISSTPLPDIVTAATCTITATGQLSASSFTAANTASPGAHTIEVTGSTGDFATATLLVLGPAIVLNPNSGPVGTTVSITGSGFLAADAGLCVISSSPTPIITPVGCTITPGGTLTSTSFSINVGAAAATYTIIVQGGTASDFATASFKVTTTGPTITLNPISGPVGTVVLVTGSGFNPIDAGVCAISSTPLPDIVTVASCTITASGQLTGASFTVKNPAALGAHIIQVKGSPANDFATATFTVTNPAPTITLTPSSGPVSTSVTVTGTGFLAADAGLCVISSSPTPIITPVGCTITPGGTLTSTSFNINLGAVAGVYTIKVQGASVSDFASAVFVVVAPTITVSPAGGPTGSTVTVKASNFKSADTSISFAGGGLTMGTTSCPINPAGSGSCAFTSMMTGAGGSYVITGTGNTGDSAQATFTIITSGIIITPSAGPPGTLVSIAGFITGATGATSCTIAGGSGSGISINTSSCTILNSALPSSFVGSFVVGNNSPGTYSVRVSGSGGSGSPNFIETTFTVTAPQITLNPNSGGIGATVLISGSGFSFADNTCSLSSSSSLIHQGGCSINGGTGSVTASFNVGNIAPGTYTVRVTGNTGDFAEATFTVTSGPSITLNPATGAPGTIVSVTGIGFLPQDSSCSISGTGVGSPACSIVIGSSTPTGSFQISAVAAGSYTITLSASGGDSAQAILTVTPQGPSLILTPTYQNPGATVTFVGRGLLSIDTSCTVTSNPGPNGALLVTNPSCSISSGTATGSFVVNPLSTADGHYTVTVTGNPGGDVVTNNQFTVVPAISISPTSGVLGTVVSVTGSGFSSKATNPCTLTASPAALFSSSSCGFSLPGPNGNGIISGGFTVATATAGVYVVTASDNQGFSTSIIFQVGTPTAQLTVSPNITPPASTVSVSGSGFNGGDGSCSITPIPGVISSSSCNVSGGTLGGSVTIASGAAPGIYLITATSSPSGSFASNFLAVEVITTATTTTSTTTSSTTATTTSTTTTSTNLKTSQTTTTLQTTGISTWIFTSRTATTTLAVTTTSIVTTVSSSSTSTFLTTITTTVLTTYTHTFGQVIQPAVNEGISPDGFGVVALLLLAIPFLFRRFTD